MSGETDQASAGEAPLSKTKQLLKNCWSCRVLSGGGCILAALFVYNEAKKTMRLGYPTTFGTVVQLTFAASLAAWGIVVIGNPDEKPKRTA